MDLDVNDDVDEVAKDFEGADGMAHLEGDSDVEELVVEEAKVATVARDPRSS